MSILTMAAQSTIRVGSRVYLRNAVAGEPGVVMTFDRGGRAGIDWPDMPEIGRLTFHALDTLEIDEGFTVSQFAFEFGERAA